MAVSQGNQGQSGKQFGQNIVIGLGEFSDQLITQLMARYYEQTVRGNVFGVVFAAAATAAPSATALPAFALWNPAGSGKNLVMLAIKAYLSTFAVGTTATAVGLVPVLNQQPTSVGAGNTPRCSLIGAPSTSVAATYVSGTIVGANTTSSRIISAQYLDLAAGDVDDIPTDKIEGSVIVAPNNGITLCGIGGTPGNLTIGASMEWMEVAI